MTVYLKCVQTQNIRAHPLTQWDILLGVGPLCIFIGCFAYIINNFFPLVRVHAWRQCLYVMDRAIHFERFIEGQTHLANWLFVQNLHTTSKHVPKNIPNIEGVDVCKTPQLLTKNHVVIILQFGLPPV